MQRVNRSYEPQKGLLAGRLAGENEDPRMVEQPEAQLRRIVIDIDAPESRINLETPHQFEAQPSGKQVVVGTA